MSITSLTSAQLAQISVLIQKKEKLVAEIEQLDRQIIAVESGSAPAMASVAAAPAGTGRRGRPKGSVAKAPKAPKADGPVKKEKGTRKRGALKETVVAVVKAAGPGGITVKDIAAQVKRPATAIHSFFYTTGKGITEFVKLDNGHIVWKEAAAAAAAPAPTPAPAAVPAAAA